MSFPNNRHGNTPPYLLSAYGIAVKHGYTGTEEEWLASLKGDQGEYPRLSYQTPTSGDEVQHGIFYRYADEGDWTNLCWLDDLMTAAEADIINAAKGYADTAEAYAKGTVDGEAVEEGDPGYEDNAKYYAGQASTYASAAGGFATGASNYAQAASGYATTASGHADNAAASATAAAGSASDAAGSATSASTSAGSASTSASSAQAQATQAGTYAYNADQSAQQAASYAAAANTAYGAVVDVANAVDVKVEDIETQVSIAAGYATNAGTSATNASGSATAAAGSATAAAGSASNAADSATAAAGSATAAAGSATSVSESAAQITTNKNDIADLKSALDSAIDGYIDIGAWHENRYIKANGEAQTYNGWKATAYLEVGNAKKLTIEATAASPGAYNAFYDSEKAHLGDNFSFNAGDNTIDIPEGAYYYRLSMPNAVNIAIKWWLAADVEDTSKKIDEITDALTDSGILVPGYYEIGEWTFGSYILTNVSVGATVDITPVESAAYGYKIIECLVGDKFSVTGTGGNNSRLWAFTDSNYKLLSKTSATSGQQTDVLLTAPEDGYLIVNTYTGASATYSVKKYQYVSEIVTRINEKLDKGFYSLNDVIKNSNPGYINIGAVGDTIDYTPIYSSSKLFGVFQVSQSDVFKITGSGGDASRLWCFVDSNDVVLSRSAANLSITDLILVAPANGKLIINTYFKNYNIRKQLNDGGIVYDKAVEKAGYDSRNNGLDILSAFNNVTCCGDSLTASVVYTHDNGDGTHQVRSAYKKYPWILGQKIGAEAESVATGGYTATDWWGAYASRIVQKENHLIIIYLGTNGGLTDTLATDAPGTDYTQYANTNTGNYCKMVAKSLEVGARVLLIKIHHGGGGDTFTTNDVIDQIAEKFNVAVVNVPELQERKYHAFPDNTGINDLHLNDLGYAAFAEALIRNVGNLPDDMMVRLIPV